jgi:hypothetical protein
VVVVVVVAGVSMTGGTLEVVGVVVGADETVTEVVKPAES